MVPQATQTSATIRRLPAGTSRKLAAKAAKRASAKAAYAAKRAQQQADAPPPKEVAAEAARQLLLRRQAHRQYQAARRAQRRANATFDMPAVLPFLTTRPCPVTGIFLLHYNKSYNSCTSTSNKFARSTNQLLSPSLAPR